MINKTDCIFCKIVNGDIPSLKVYEDENTIAFLDITPVHLGHTLIIPKTHSKNILDMGQREALAMMKTIKIVAKAVKKAANADGFNIIMNNFKAAGQIIDHAHVHIIPRFEGDGLKHWSPVKKYENSELEEVKNHIINELE